MTLILNYIYCIPLQKECVSVHFGLRLFNNLAYLENFMKTPMRWHIWTARLDLKIKIHLKKGSQAKDLLFIELVHCNSAETYDIQNFKFALLIL